MPFPLAHPAVVLPLRRLCPRWLSAPALILGSISPDVAYAFGKLRLEEFSHTLWGLVAFCLPTGVLLTWLWHVFRSRFAGRLAERYRFAFAAETAQPFGSIAKIALSVLIGAATHLLWDSFTHRGGWAVERMPILETSVGTFAGHTVRLYRVLWYGSTFAGIACVYLAFRGAWTWLAPAGAKAVSVAEGLRATLVSVLVLPLALVHDAIPSTAGTFLVGSLTCLLVIGVVWTTTRLSPRRSPPAVSGESPTAPAD